VEVRCDDTNVQILAIDLCCREALTPGTEHSGAGADAERPGREKGYGMKAPEESKPPPTPAKTILFADDDGSLQKFVAALLHRLGYHVIVASDGNEALSKAQGFKGTIDLLLSDIEMPGMTGVELALQISLLRPETKILLISGLDSGLLVLNNGWQFLPKPFVADMLRDRIRDALGGQPAVEEHGPHVVRAAANMDDAA